MDHPVHILVDHDRVEVLQVQHISIAIGTWSGRRGRVGGRGERSYCVITVHYYYIAILGS